MKRSEAIKNLLTSRTHSDLAAMYDSCMEVQVNVAQGSGERIDKDYKGKRFQSYSDGISTWNHFRIPLNAKTEPEDNDTDISYNLSEHVEGIGMTGWDWKHKQSKWVAFDFDAITGHSERHAKKLSEAELRKIQESVLDIPWVTTRRSTSGKGLHLYVFLKGVTTNNHVEHAALARAILGLMSGLTGQDLVSSVDTCGGNMWVWHRKQVNTNGLTLIKQGTELSDIPVNWKDHMKVVSSNRKRILPTFIEESNVPDIERMFNELTGSRTHVPLDEGHQRLVRFLHETGAQAWFDSDNHVLVTHTIHLKEAHEKLGLRGVFKTISKGIDKGNDWNLFAHPSRNGAWVLRRFTPGTQEESTWDIDGSGWTRCFYNQDPDLKTIARSKGAIEHTSGAFFFREAEVAVSTAKEVGVDINIPSWIRSRSAKIKHHKDGRLIVQIEHQVNDMANEMSGWLAEKGNWTKIFNAKTAVQTEPEIGNYDDTLRHLITESECDCGWVLKSERSWREEPLVHVRTYLKALNMKANEIDIVLGSCIAKPWRIVCQPFGDEEPGDRQWNRNAPQFAYTPTASDTLTYPHWLMILEHIGNGLNDAVKQNEWCRSFGILTGADYLKLWIASLFKEPLQPLPYLFLYSTEQNTGKSMLHDAISLLVTGGVERADNALLNPQGFNGELENKILCVVEETDLRKNKQAYSRIKDYVTSIELPIHPKNKTPYTVPNTTHWIHTSNDYQDCPILPGDSRIVMIQVSVLGNVIPRKTLLPMLEKEAPDFLASVLTLELPPSNDRLNIPVIDTQAKKFAERASMSYLDMFVEEHCFLIDGARIKFSEFYEKFKEWLDVDQIRMYSKIKVARDLAPRFPKGRSVQDNQVYLGNVSWNATTPATTKLRLDGEHIV